MVSPSSVALAALAAVILLLALRQAAWLALRLALDRARLPPGFGAWARRHPLRARFKARFPRLAAWLGARLTPSTFTGLPLTLMAVAALYLAALFGGLVEEVMEGGEILRVDTRIGDLFTPWRVGPVVSAFLWITTLGDSAALVGVVVVGTGLLWAHGRARLVLPLWITFLGSQATTWIGKFALARERPDFVTAATALSPAFPSGHATGAAAVYGFLAYAIARDLAGTRQRFEVAYWTLLLVGLIGFSRVFLAVHYVSDVAGGFLVGGFWLLVGFAVAERGRPSAG